MHRTSGTPRSPPSELNTTLYQHAQDLGKIGATLKHHEHRITKLEGKALMGMSPIQFVQIGIGVAVLGAAVMGKISWGESLPIIGRAFTGG